MKKLHLSKDVTFDLDAMMQTWALLGNKGGGKTMTMQMLFELVHRAGAQGIAVTPVSNWWSLLFAADGVSPGLKGVYVFGGKRAHYPLRPQDGELIARLLIQKRISVVIDVSMMRKSERRRFLTDFFEEFYRLKKLEDEPSASVMFLEEAHAFCPQRPQPDEARMLGAVEDICREGRNYGIGFVLGDQRPATVNKNVLALAEVLIALRTTWKDDRKTYAEWIEQHGIESDLDINALLPHFKAGEAIVYAPLYGILKHTQLNKKTTLDASATQKIGVKASKIGELTPVDDAEIKSAMAQVEEEIAATDPKALQKRVRELEAEITRLKARPPQVEIKEVEVAGLPDELLEQLKDALQHAEEKRTAVEKLAHQVLAHAKLKPRKKPGHFVTMGPSKPVSHVPPPRALPKVTGGGPREAEGIVGKARDMLRVLAAFDNLSRHELGVLVQMDYSGGGFRNYLGALHNAGLIHLSHAGAVAITYEGKLKVDDELGGQTKPTTNELVERWKQKLTGKARDILQLAVDAYPNEISRVELAQRVDMDAAGGGFRNYLGSLSGPGLIEFPSSGMVRASDALFK